MDIKNLKTEFIISKVPSHKKHKTILLDLIDKMPNNSYNNISKTDWNLPKDFERKYLDYFYSAIAINIMNKLKKYFKVQTWKINNGWFNQYNTNSFHEYHTHPQTNFTNVYFIELPDPHFKTAIKIRDKEYEYNIKEGQIITFPGHIVHSSKSNGDKRKTVISFNCDFLVD